MANNFSWGSNIKNTNSINYLKTQVDNLQDSLDQVIDGLSNGGIVNFRGNWTDGTNAKKGDIYSYNNQLWLCGVEQTSNAPSEGNEWAQISSVDVNVTENETPIPNYQINGKQVYRKYITTTAELKNTTAIADYMELKGRAKSSNGYLKGVSWFWGDNQNFNLDVQSDGGVVSNGFAESGHKLIVEYTKLEE